MLKEKNKPKLESFVPKDKPRLNYNFILFQEYNLLQVNLNFLMSTSEVIFMIKALPFLPSNLPALFLTLSPKTLSLPHVFLPLGNKNKETCFLPSRLASFHPKSRVKSHLVTLVPGALWVSPGQYICPPETSESETAQEDVKGSELTLEIYLTRGWILKSAHKQ